MTPEEIKAQLKLHISQYDIRAERLKKMALLNPPNSLITAGLKLLEDSVNHLKMYSGDLKEVERNLKLFNAEMLLQKAMNAEEIEAVEAQQEEDFAKLTEEIIEEIKNEYKHFSESLIINITTLTIKKLREKGGYLL